MNKTASYLLFLRHGDAAVPIDTYPHHHTMKLSCRGSRQAEAVARDLKGFNISRIVTSPLQRAIETAAPISKALNVQTEVDARLEERVFRPLYNMSYNEIAKTFGTKKVEALRNGNSDQLSFDGVDGLPAYSQRVSECMAELGSAVTGVTLVVAHGGPHDWYLGTLLSDPVTATVRRWFRLGKCRASLLRYVGGYPLPESILGTNLSVTDARQMVEADIHAAR